MEYYDYNNMWERPYKNPEESFPRHRNKKRNYNERVTCDEQPNVESTKKYRDYRKSYRGYRNDYHVDSHDKKSYIREDRDLRNVTYGRSPIKKRHNYSYDKEMKHFHKNENGQECSSSSESSSNKTQNKRIKLEPQSTNSNHCGHEIDENGNDSDENDLSKELHPISYYLDTDDREEMLIQVFKVINGSKLRAMLPPILKDMDLSELKVECLKQLEGMSKKRLRSIFSGEVLEDSSETDEGENRETILSETNSENKYSKSKRKMKNNFHGESMMKQEKGIPFTRDKVDGKIIKQEKSRKKMEEKCVLGNVSDAIQFKSSNNSNERFRVSNVCSTLKSSSSDEDLETVIASRNREKKRKSNLKEDSKKKEKAQKSKTKKKDFGNSDRSINEEITRSLLNTEDKSEKTLMELLELEMRARAIKALLESKTNDENLNEKVERNENTSNSGISNDQNGRKGLEPMNSEPPNEEEMKRKRQIQIAKEQLHISEAKKREEEELIERQQEEIRQRLEEQQKLQKEQEAEEERKKSLEAERKLKAQKKKEEYEKFLIWKEERQKKKEEKEALKLKRLKESEWNEREKIRKKIYKMREREKFVNKSYENQFNTSPNESQLPGVDEQKMDCVNMEDEEDDLNREFDITFDFSETSLEEGEIDYNFRSKYDTEMYIYDILLDMIFKAVSVSASSENLGIVNGVIPIDEIHLSQNDDDLRDYIFNILFECIRKKVPFTKHAANSIDYKNESFQDHFGMMYYKNRALREQTNEKNQEMESELSALEVIMQNYDGEENLKTRVINPQVTIILKEAEKRLFLIDQDDKNKKKLHLLQVESNRDDEIRKHFDNFEKEDHYKESVITLTKSKDPRTRMILHHLPKRSKKETKRTNSDMSKFEASPPKSKKDKTEPSHHLTKKMSRQAKRIERMRAFVDQSDMQNLFHANNNYDVITKQITGENDLYSNFVKEKDANESNEKNIKSDQKITTRNSNDYEEDYFTETHKLNEKADENALSKSNVTPQPSNESTKLDESPSEAEDDGDNDNHLWNTIMRKN